MRHTCKRCGYETEYKQVLIRHLQKKKTCEGMPSRDELLRELGVVLNVKTNDGFEHDNKVEICESKVNIGALLDELKDLRQKVHKLECNRDITIDYEKSLKQLKIEVAILKNKKTEDVYQAILEQHLGGKHKMLKNGVTDVTTPDFHAEIKDWQCWKEAIGQLITYNMEDPKELRVYLFGKCPGQDKKKTIIESFKRIRIIPFEIFVQADECTIVSYQHDNPEKYVFHISDR